MDIAHVSIGALPSVFTPRGGAIQRRVAELAITQTRRGHNVIVFSPSERAGVREVAGIEVNDVRCALPTPASYLEYQTRIVAHLLRRRRQPSVVHVHSEPEAAVIGAPLRSAMVLSYDNFYFRGDAAR